jgi:hypothetical protein
MEEKTIFNGSPSQLSHLGYYILCAILTPVFGLGVLMFLIRFLNTKFTNIEITNERIIEKTGILSKKTDETELYRVKDIRLEEPFFLRMFGLSNILLVTTDKSSPLISLNGVQNGPELRKELRNMVEARRDKKGVRERDID